MNTTHYPWHSRDNACARLDRVMASRDPALFTVLNGPIQRYEVWRRNADGSLHLVKRLEDELGEHVSPDWMKGYILERLTAADRPASTVLREIDDANERLVEDRWKNLIDYCVDVGSYYRRAIAIESSGMASPYSRDLADHWQQLAATERERVLAGEFLG